MIHINCVTVINLAFAMLILVGQTAIGSDVEKPNIIVFMADDMGYADTGFTGATDIKTPNLDQLAASGVTFSSGYVTHPYCGPSRAGLLSGRYQHRFGFETNPAYDPSNPYVGIDPDEVLFPQRLKKAGYRTGVIGKWHLGAAPPFHPLNRGFDYFYGFLGGGHDYFRIDLTKPVKEGYLQSLERNGRPAEFEGYLTTALSEDAAEFVRATNEGEPFFLYVAYNAPHSPLQAPKEAIERYSHIQERKRRLYAAMVDAMDAGIGKVIAAVEEKGIRENTLVFFLSDNGGPQANENNPGKWNGSSNAPFRGGKGNLYDGGVHVPFIASWPGRITAGSVYESPVISLDIAATAVACAGISAEQTADLEGVDLIPLLSGEQQSAPHEFLFWRENGGSRWSILTSDFHKHVQDKANKSAELFHLVDDKSEQKDLTNSSPEMASSLLDQWNDWNQSNVPNRIEAYRNYHKLRDQFFLDAIPNKAKNNGYAPEPIPTLR